MMMLPRSHPKLDYFNNSKHCFKALGQCDPNKCPVWSSVKDKKEGKMYGILLESVQYFVMKDVGEAVWHKILEHAGMKNLVFSTHNTYSDDLMVKLASSCCHITKCKDFNQWMTFFGTCFVEFCSLYGYDNLLRVSGRYYRDFLHGIDNIHEIIRFSYPRLRSPSFLVLFEDSEGCVLLYQSNRMGFKHYVKGQLSQIAKKFYEVTVDITIIEEDITDNVCSVKFRLDFDNSVYSSKAAPTTISGKQTFSSISGDTFLKVFPFCVIFNNQLIIKNVGHSMAAFLKGDNLVGCHLREKFHIRRPLIPCIWNRILRFQRVIFELEYLQDDSDLSDFEDSQDSKLKKDGTETMKSDNQKCLLRGEMKYIQDWDMVAFLCTPLLNNLKDLQTAGLYINDLNMFDMSRDMIEMIQMSTHNIGLNNLKDLQTAGLYINDLNMFDMSRDMIMTGCWEHASQLERSIEQQRDKSEKISENMSEIEEWKKKSDSLLYSMIPESIAERLKSGMNPIDTCQVFDIVTIMFVYMVGFADICTSSSPMEIVKCINNLFVEFDQIVDQYDVFKVETLGDAVYMVAGGVPDRNPNHAINVATVALKLQDLAKTVIQRMGKDNLNTRIGMHSGGVVGGVVGRRMPQYCLFGDTVNTASRMQTYSLPGRIHVSEPCKECLKGSKFITVKRGKVNVKGKGEMQTYWLVGEEGDVRNKQVMKELSETLPPVTKTNSYENALDLYGMHASTSYAQIELKPGSRRVSESQRLSSTQFLSPLHEHHLPKHSNISDTLEATNKQTDLGVVSDTNVDSSESLEIKIGEVPFHLGSRKESNSAEEPISFFLDNSDAMSISSLNIDESELGAVGGISESENVIHAEASDKELRTVADGENISENFSTDAMREKIRKQKNYAKFMEIRRRLSLEERRKPVLRENFSILGPFTFGSEGRERTYPGEEPIRNPQHKPQGLSRANTDSYLGEGYNNDRSNSLPHIRFNVDKVRAYNKERSLSDQSYPSMAGCPFSTLMKSKQYWNHGLFGQAPSVHESDTENNDVISPGEIIEHNETLDENSDIVCVENLHQPNKFTQPSNITNTQNEGNEKLYISHVFKDCGVTSLVGTNKAVNELGHVTEYNGTNEILTKASQPICTSGLETENLGQAYRMSIEEEDNLISETQAVHSTCKNDFESENLGKTYSMPLEDKIDEVETDFDTADCNGLDTNSDCDQNENSIKTPDSATIVNTPSMQNFKSDQISTTKSVGQNLTNGSVSIDDKHGDVDQTILYNGLSFEESQLCHSICNGHGNIFVKKSTENSKIS